MNYLYESLDKPTRLYIKKCSHCELKYFGKTTSEDIEKYPGSGIYWSRHLKKHNAESIHLWNSDWYYYDMSISRFALKFSHMNKIVESDLWANMRPEDGLEGGWYYVNNNKEISTRSGKSRLGEKNGMYGKKRTQETKYLMSKNRKGINTGPQTQEHINNKRLTKCKVYRVIDPNNVEYIVPDLVTFCSKNDLAYKTMSKLPYNHRQPKRGKCAGWRCYFY